MLNQNLILKLSIVLIASINWCTAQTNQFDKSGKRHGLWTKNYHKTDQKRYEGTFVHGKEVDTFKYYTLSKGKSVLSATKVFNKTDSIAEVTFYTSKKKVISKGKMNGKRYIGKWIYYHKNSTKEMIVEFFNNKGKLEGERIVLYKQGNIAEKANYKDGELEGSFQLYSEDNKLLRKSVYKKGKLNGKTINYDSDGNVASEGNYKDDKKRGIWKYYEKGKIKKEIDHTNKKVIKKY